VSALKVISEVPPTRVSVSVETPTRRRYGWSIDNPNGEQVPSGLRWSSVAPGGFETADCLLPRDPRITYNDLEPLSDLRVIGASGDVAGEYRLEGAPVTSGDQMSISPSAVGWQAGLEDDQTKSVVFIDRDLAQWIDTPEQRKENLRSYNYAPGNGQFAVDAGVPAQLTLSVTQLSQAAGVPSTDPNQPVSIAEAFYDAGPSNYIGEIRADYTSSNLDNPTPDWWPGAVIGTNQLFNNGLFYAYSGRLPQPATPTTGTFLLSCGSLTKTRWGLLQLFYSQASGAAGQWSFMFENLRVIGNHGLAIQGANAQIEGVLASDAVTYIINTFCPLLYCDGTTIEPSTYIIPQLAFHDPVSPGTMVNEATKYGSPLPDWFVWEKRPTDTRAPFYLHARGTQNRQWRARIGPSQLSEAGPDINRIWNSIVVSFTDVDGTTHTVGPPGSGADVEDGRLVDDDPQNPANQLGIQRRNLLSMGMTSTSDVAIDVGIAFFNEMKSISRAGAAVIVGWAQDDHGVVEPYWKLRAGDEIAFVDAADTSYRRIVRVDNNDATRTASLTLDAPPDTLQGLLERLGVEISSVGIG
jgi:hypothetical protein